MDSASEPLITQLNLSRKKLSKSHQKIADYMKANPSARFEVQGHTDNQGNDKINDPLSQQRAEAVVKALEGMGVDGFNLRAVGKGSHEPVADNSTEAGRAKNRRVEFIKK